MFTIQEIKWQNHREFNSEIQGIFNGQEIFTIKPVGKNSNQWSLLSWAFKNETFNNSTNPKELGVFSSIDSAQKLAESKWNDFVNQLVTP